MKLSNLFEEKIISRSLTRDKLMRVNKKHLIIEVSLGRGESVYTIKDVPPTISEEQFWQLYKISFEQESLDDDVEIYPLNLTEFPNPQEWMNYYLLNRHSFDMIKWKEFVKTMKKEYPLEDDDFNESQVDAHLKIRKELARAGHTRTELTPDEARDAMEKNLAINIGGLKNVHIIKDIPRLHLNQIEKLLQVSFDESRRGKHSAPGIPARIGWTINNRLSVIALNDADSKSFGKIYKKDRVKFVEWKEIVATMDRIMAQPIFQSNDDFDE